MLTAISCRGRESRALAGGASAGQIGRVTANSDAPRAPYSLEPTAFPFPALASLAGRAALGGQREIVLACLLVARVVVDAGKTNGGGLLTLDQRRARAKEVTDWLAATTIPVAVKTALATLAAGTTVEDPGQLSAALESVMTVTANHLDPAARLELGRLAQTAEK
jgi:hypothetical protein